MEVNLQLDPVEVVEVEVVEDNKMDQDIREKISDQFGEDLMVLDGYDDCIIGVCERFGMDDVVLYDKEKIIQKLMKDMGNEDAMEYFEYNIIGFFVGAKTPAFFERII